MQRGKWRGDSDKTKLQNVINVMIPRRNEKEKSNRLLLCDVRAVNLELQFCKNTQLDDIHNTPKTKN